MPELPITAPSYSPLLKQIHRPPSRLWYYGNTALLKSFCFTIVGSRRPTAYAHQVLEKIIPELVQAGFTIVSGLAYGVDYLAHSLTLAAGGQTIAVLGSGINNPYPTSHRRLYEKICKQGLVLSEYPDLTEPANYTFPQRNRIMNGLARGVLVVEAGERSGSLLTAQLALDEGREVFAVPGSIFSEVSRGTNQLIMNNQAKLILSAADILVEFGVSYTNPPPSTLPLLSPEEQSVYQNLSAVPQPLDQLVEKLGCQSSQILALLTQLELKNCASEQSSGWWRKK